MKKPLSRATDFSDPDQIVGYVVIVGFQYNSHKPDAKRHWLGSVAACNRKARMMRNFREVISMEPVKAGAWLRAYGKGKM